jgi:hypothetical protein
MQQLNQSKGWLSQILEAEHDSLRSAAKSWKQIMANMIVIFLTGHQYHIPMTKD